MNAIDKTPKNRLWQPGQSGNPAGRFRGRAPLCLAERQQLQQMELEARSGMRAPPFEQGADDRRSSAP